MSASWWHRPAPPRPSPRSTDKEFADAFAYIDSHGGIDGKKVDLVTVDYGYDPVRAIATYKGWKETLKPVAIQGWGTADTEALVDYVTKDGVVFMSGSSSGHLTDPTGRSPWTERPAPYNFFYGPSYSDGCRALVQFAAEQWKRTGTAARGSTFLGDLYRPKFVYMGDNHPYPNAPKAACVDYARDLEFEVLPPIRYSLTPGNFSAQCDTLRQNGANYAFLANTAESNVALLKDCAKVGVNTQFLTNIYGWDRAAAKEAGDAGNGLIWVVSVARWNDDVPGMKLVHEVSRESDPERAGRLPLRPLHPWRLLGLLDARRDGGGRQSRGRYRAEHQEGVRGNARPRAGRP